MMTFTEVADFDLDDLMPHIGWIGDRPLHIYTKDNTQSYFIHDRGADRLFEMITDRGKIRNKEDYKEVIEAFHLYRQL